MLDSIDLKESAESSIVALSQLIDGEIPQGNLVNLGKILTQNTTVVSSLDDQPELQDGYRKLGERLEDLIFNSVDFAGDLEKIRGLAHHLEQLFQAKRNGTAVSDPHLTYNLIPNGTGPDVSAATYNHEGVIQVLTPELKEDSIAAEFISETEESLTLAENMLLALETDYSRVDELIHPLFRAMHTLKGNSAAFELTVIKRLAHHMEDVLDLLRKGLAPSPELLEILFLGLDTLGMLIAQLRKLIEGETPQPVSVAKVFSLLQQTLEAHGQAANHNPPVTVLGAGSVEQTRLEPPQLPNSEPAHKPAETVGSEAPPPPNTEPANKSAEAHGGHKVAEMIKVPTLKLDELSELIGELVVALSVLNQSTVIESISDRQTRERMDQLGKVTESLRERILGIRMFPLVDVFAKLKRQVRDLAHTCDKSLNLVMEGEDTLVDKTVVDAIHAPLMHLVRNAIDHGVEPTQERLASGKSPSATIKVSATHQGDSVLMKVSDDGRGIDAQAVLAKALERGLIKPGEELTERQIYQLIFQPGFSTAKQVTDVSGRGVGLDVVKKGIEHLRGRLQVESQPGRGSSFSVILPLTTSIIEGLVVRVGQSLFVLPILDVHAMVAPKPEELKNVHDHKGLMFLYAGEMVPIIRLYQTFNIQAEYTDPSEAIVAIIVEGSRKYGLMVDELLHRQQVVIKKLSNRFCDVKGISGGTILGNGRIGLILAPHDLLQAEIL